MSDFTPGDRALLEAVLSDVPPIAPRWVEDLVRKSLCAFDTAEAERGELVQKVNELAERISRVLALCEEARARGRWDVSPSITPRDLYRALGVEP